MDLEFQAMKTAKSWGLTPAQWRCLESDDQARMMVHDWLEGVREGYEAEKQEEASKKQGSKSGEPMLRQSDGGMLQDMMAGLGPQV